MHGCRLLCQQEVVFWSSTIFGKNDAAFNDVWRNYFSCVGWETRILAVLAKEVSVI